MMEYLTTIAHFTNLGAISWVMLLILFFVGYTYLTRSPWTNLPPGPWSVPIFGSVPFLPSSHIYKSMNMLWHTYGEVFTVYLTQRIVVVNGYSAIQEMLVKKGHLFADRPDIVLTSVTKKKGIVASSGELWKEQRRYVLHVLRDFGLGKSIMEDKIHEEVGYFLEELTALEGQPLDPTHLVQRSVTNIATSLAFGKRMEYEDPEFEAQLYSIKCTNEVLSPASMAVTFPFTHYLPGDVSGWKKGMQELEKSKDRYRRWIEEHKARDPDEEATNLIGRYVNMLRNKENVAGTTFSEEELLYIISDLYVAGSDTTTSTLKWLIAFMALNPEVQSKVQAEIDEKIGQNRVPKMADRPMVPYTEAVLNETQRLGEIAGLNLPHAPVEDVIFRGFTIPKGTTVVANFHSIHSDPTIYPEPEKFNPSHFLDADGKLVKREELIPFSMGKRVCLGEGLARMELFLFFTRMMQHFSFAPVDDADKPSYEGVFSFTYQPKPYKIIITSR